MFHVGVCGFITAIQIEVQSSPWTRTGESGSTGSGRGAATPAASCSSSSVAVGFGLGLDFTSTPAPACSSSSGSLDHMACSSSHGVSLGLPATLDQYDVDVDDVTDDDVVHVTETSETTSGGGHSHLSRSSEKSHAARHNRQLAEIAEARAQARGEKEKQQKRRRSRSPAVGHTHSDGSISHSSSSILCVLVPLVE